MYFFIQKNIGQILSLKKSCLTLCSENTSTRLSRHRPYMNTSHDHTILYWILLQCIYWRLYWIIGGFYQKCVCMGFLYIYFVEIGSKTRTGFSLDFVLDNWWIFVTQILCKIHQISSPRLRHVNTKFAHMNGHWKAYNDFTSISF